MPGLENQHKEWFSRSFLQATSAQAGIAVEFVDKDVYGVDAVLTEGRSSVDVQLKATANLARDTELRPVFDLKAATYEQLRQLDRHSYAYLVVVELPESKSEWVVHEPSSTLLAREAYFVLLSGMPPTSNVATVRITIPRENLLTSSALESIIRRSHSSRRLLVV